MKTIMVITILCLLFSGCSVLSMSGRSLGKASTVVDLTKWELGEDK
jgi:hypothetical protein